MYSHEINEFLWSRDYSLTIPEYCHLTNIKDSPQISRIKYDPFTDKFEMWTSDGWYWIFCIVKS